MASENEKFVVARPTNPKAVQVAGRGGSSLIPAGGLFYFILLFTFITTYKGPHDALYWGLLVINLAGFCLAGFSLTRSMLGKNTYSQLREKGEIIELANGKVFTRAFDAVCKDEDLKLTKEEQKQYLAGQFMFEAATDVQEAVRLHAGLKGKEGQKAQRRREEAKIRARIRQAVQLIKTDRESLALQRGPNVESGADGGTAVPGVSDADVDAELEKMQPRQIQPGKQLGS